MKLQDETLKTPIRRFDDKMIEKAIRNLKKVRRLKPFVGVVGLVGLVQSGFMGYILYQHIQEPWHSSARSVVHVAYLIFFTGFLLYIGVQLFCMGFLRNYKDIILEHLAEQYLEQQRKNKDKPENESG